MLAVIDAKAFACFTTGVVEQWETQGLALFLQAVEERLALVGGVGRDRHQHASRDLDLLVLLAQPN